MMASSIILVGIHNFEKPEVASQNDEISCVDWFNNTKIAATCSVVLQIMEITIIAINP